MLFFLIQEVYVTHFSHNLLLAVRLRQMPAQLLRFPSQALKVKVAGFKPPSVNKQEDVLPYSPGWSVKAAQKMLELLHGSITAAVLVSLV